jgi:dUTP pyrophosphatase
MGDDRVRVAYPLPEVLFRVVRPAGQIPSRAHRTDAGFDLHATERVWLGNGPGSRIRSVGVIGTGVAVAIPEGHVGMVCSRSGLAAQGVIVANAPGIIDPGYRGELKVILANIGHGDTFTVRAGDRVAQLVIVPAPALEAVTVGEFPERTDRGTGGLGSTGR